MKYPFITDKKHRPVMVGDVIKVHHFIAGIRRYWMFKWVVSMECHNGNSFYVISHLHKPQNVLAEKYIVHADEKCRLGWEIVQGYGDGNPFYDRKKIVQPGA